MLQVDLLFSYGMSSGIALAAKDQVAKEKSLWVNKYFLVTVLWLAFCFSSQMLYLLSRFPEWESMFVIGSSADVPVWLASGMSIAMILIGILGFSITSRFLRKGKVAPAVAQVVWSVAAALFISSYGWDGTGFKRLVYAGTGTDWANGVRFAATDFLTSPVFLNLLWLEALLIVPYVMILVLWIREGRGATHDTHCHTARGL